MKQMNYKLEVLNILKDVVKNYPNQLLSTHISIALSDYSNFDSLSDKELYYLFEKYRCEKELDLEIPHSSNINEIIEDGLRLNLDEEDDEDGY